ncbi:MAG: AbrB/MazE/SpoVT family DNA-binding domain-containing protein [Synechococcus sp.]|nr:AbrB/MazE/SpoVT family DNA-binding domain-containing protein [Synechococcus sp.]
MRSTITSRGQTVIPAAIRERFALGPSQRLEWLVEADGSIRVIPVAASPIEAFRGQGKRGGSTGRLVADRQAEASLDA